jgi:hypothetical protein
MTPLPVRFAGSSVSQVEASVKVSWQVATESNILRYDIERSIDGREFTTIGSQNSKGNNNTLVNYSWMDNSPAYGTNYYRIKAVDKDGSSTYTSTMKINTTRSKIDVIVAPNPIRNNEMNVQLSSLTKGSYTVRVINNMGQVVFNSKVATEGGSLSQAFRLPATIKGGVYTLQVAGNDINLNKKIVIE